METDSIQREPHPLRRADDQAFTRRIVKRSADVLLQYGAIGVICLFFMTVFGFGFKWMHDADASRQQEQTALIKSQGAALEESRNQNAQFAQQFAQQAQQTLQVVGSNTAMMESVKTELRNLGDRMTRVETAIHRNDRAEIVPLDDEEKRTP